MEEELSRLHSSPLRCGGAASCLHFLHHLEAAEAEARRPPGSSSRPWSSRGDDNLNLDVLDYCVEALDFCTHEFWCTGVA
uniref:Uncharacterized protein n=1 Tax=Oryza punctata TaxID=4537 RepID=A0A0E0MJ74_ORYPU